MLHHRDEPEGLVGPECQELCSYLGPTIDWELWEGFLRGMGVAWAAASGTEITASLGQQGGEGAEEETRTGADPLPPPPGH